MYVGMIIPSNAQNNITMKYKNINGNCHSGELQVMLTISFFFLTFIILIYF